jgi:hypothetical protein
MADISNFVSALTQGNDDYVGVENAAQLSIQTTPLPSADWGRVHRFTDNNSRGGLVANIFADNVTPPTTNHIIYGFYVYFDDATPTTSFRPFGIGLDGMTDSANRECFIRLNTDGTLTLDINTEILTTSSGAVFSDATWHLVEIRFLPSTNATSNDGEFQMWVDGTEVIANQTGVDWNQDFDAITTVGWWGPLAEAGDVYMYLAGAYMMINSTAASDRLDSDFEVIGPYQSAQSGATPDVGNDSGAPENDDLDGDGTNWATVSEIPFTDQTDNTDTAEYDGTPLDGGLFTDHASRGGPSGDSRIDGDSNMKAWKGLYRVDRGNGGGTTHTGYLGDSGIATLAGADSFNMGDVGGPVNRYFVTDDSTNMPTSSQNFCIGAGVSGARNLYMQEFAAFILHTPDAATNIEGTLHTETDTLYHGLITQNLEGSLFTDSDQLFHGEVAEVIASQDIEGTH